MWALPPEWPQNVFSNPQVPKNGPPENTIKTHSQNNSRTCQNDLQNGLNFRALLVSFSLLVADLSRGPPQNPKIDAFGSTTLIFPIMFCKFVEYVGMWQASKSDSYITHTHTHTHKHTHTHTHTHTFLSYVFPLHFLFFNIWQASE